MSYFLLIDDDPVPRRVLACALEDRGYKATAVNSPSLAISILHRDPPRVIVSDVMMPGCSGPSLASILLQHPNGKAAELAFYTSLETVSWWQHPATILNKSTPISHIVDQLVELYERPKRMVS